MFPELFSRFSLTTKFLQTGVVGFLFVGAMQVGS